jgi:hypothetical protein
MAAGETGDRFATLEALAREYEREASKKDGPSRNPAGGMN